MGSFQGRNYFSLSTYVPIIIQLRLQMVKWITETGALWFAVITHSFLEGMKPLHYRINTINQQDLSMILETYKSV